MAGKLRLPGRGKTPKKRPRPGRSPRSQRSGSGWPRRRQRLDPLRQFAGSYVAVGNLWPAPPVSATYHSTRALGVRNDEDPSPLLRDVKLRAEGRQFDVETAHQLQTEDQKPRAGAFRWGML